MSRRVGFGQRVDAPISDQTVAEEVEPARKKLVRAFIITLCVASPLSFAFLGLSIFLYTMDNDLTEWQRAALLIAAGTVLLAVQVVLLFVTVLPAARRYREAGGT